MVNGSPDYTLPASFRRALDARLKAAAKTTGRGMQELQREFLFQRFLALIFAEPDGPWVLKGGVGLLMRVPPARFSKDLDLLHLEEPTIEEAVEELRALTEPREGDHLRFVVGDGIANNQPDNPVAEVKVDGYFGTARYGGFPIDLALKPHLLAAPERHQPAPVVDIPGLTPPPEMLVYPITDQIADKVCAMYEVHGEGHASNRYRDLVDLVLIVSTLEFEAAAAAEALAAEAARREMVLPTAMTSPAAPWTDGYRAYAAQTRVDSALHGIDEALEHVGACLNSLLDGSRAGGRWLPSKGWAD